MAIVLKNRRKSLYNPDGTVRKDPLFVPFPIKAKFHRSTLAFEDFKREFTKVGWRFEFANRFANSTNVNYLNFHFVYTPQTWYAESVRFAVSFGKFSVSVYNRILEHYEPAKILFFHYTVCDTLDYLKIYKQIWSFLDDENFNNKDYLMKMVFGKSFFTLMEKFNFELNFDLDDGFVWLTEEQVMNSRLFKLITKQRYNKNVTRIVKKPKRVVRGEIAV